MRIDRRGGQVAIKDSQRFHVGENLFAVLFIAIFKDASVNKGGILWIIFIS